MKAKYRKAAVAVAILLSSAIAKAEMSLEEQELVCHQGANAFAQGVKLSKHQSSNHQINYLTKQKEVSNESSGLKKQFLIKMMNLGYRSGKERLYEFEGSAGVERVYEACLGRTLHTHINLKTAVENLPANKNQHKLDKKKLSHGAFISRNLSNLAVLKRPPSDISSLLHLKFDTSIAMGSTAAQLHSTRQKMHIPAYKPPSHKTPCRGCW